MADFSARRVAMVDTQVRPSDVTKFPIIQAMLSVPKETFVPTDLVEAAYIGENIEIAPGRVILEPRTMGKMLDVLNVQPDELVLDIGCGLGYSSAVLARLAEAVVAIESDEAMAEEAQGLLAEEGADNVAVLNAALAEGSGENAPYDVIVIQGGVEEVPVALTDQLREGGRIAAIHMQGALGTARIGTRHGHRVVWRDEFNATAPVLEGFAKQEAFTL